MRFNRLPSDGCGVTKDALVLATFQPGTLFQAIHEVQHGVPADVPDGSNRFPEFSYRQTLRGVPDQLHDLKLHRGQLSFRLGHRISLHGIDVD